MGGPTLESHPKARQARVAKGFVQTPPWKWTDQLEVRSKSLPACMSPNTFGILEKRLFPVSFTVHSIYRVIFKIWREKRLALFLEELKPSRSDILLDVGGYPWVWAAFSQPVKRVDSLNLHPVDWSAANAPDHDIRILVGDGCALTFGDHSYDIAFSNSVIEHVGSFEQQQKFASEIRRVGKSLWVQTPAFECPIEPHYLTPFVHYFPRSTQKALLRWFSVWGWIARPDRETIRKTVDSTRLLKKSEMVRLFPDCEIRTERLLWVLPKSYIAIRKWGADTANLPAPGVKRAGDNPPATTF